MLKRWMDADPDYQLGLVTYWSECSVLLSTLCKALHLLSRAFPFELKVGRAKLCVTPLFCLALAWKVTHSLSRATRQFTPHFFLLPSFSTNGRRMGTYQSPSVWAKQKGLWFSFWPHVPDNSLACASKIAVCRCSTDYCRTRSPASWLVLSECLWDLRS